MNKLRAGMICSLCILLLGLFVLASPDARAADDVIKWRLQAFWPGSSVSYKGSALAVAKKVKERTKGRLILEPYPGAALVPTKEIFNAVKMGMIPIATVNSGYLRAQIPVMAVASGLPMAFSQPWEAIYFHTWMGFEKMLRDAAAKQGIYWVTDKCNATELVLKKKVTTFEEFSGLKLRSSGILQIYLSSIGAAASYIPGGEMYAALASGVVEGAHWGAAQGAASMKFYEIAKYHVKPPLAVSGNDGWIINLKALAKLPPDVRAILLNTLHEHFFLRTNQYTYLEERALAKAVKDQGVEVVTIPPKEYAKMQKAAVKLWDDVAKKDAACAKAVQMIKDFNRKLGRDLN